METLKKCSKCNGSGQVLSKMFFPWIKRLTECPECEGEGVVIVSNKQTKKTML